MLLSYAFVYPTWTGYDEAQHVDMVYGLQHGAGWPAPGEKMIATGVAATSDDFDRGRYQDMFQSGGKRRGAAPFAEIDPTPRDQRRSFNALGGPKPVDDGRLSNQMVQHPPLIYAAGAVVLRALPGSDDWAYDQQVFVLRLLNILVVAPLPLLAWLAARRFGLGESLALAAAVLPLAIPGFTRVGATFNNDGILMLTTGGLTVVLAGVLRGDLRRRTALWAGLWLGLALLSKAFALTLPVMIVAAYLVGWRRRRASDPAEPGVRGWRRLWRAIVSLPWLPALLAVGLGLALGGWWWVRNYLLYDAVQPNGWATNPPRREPLLLPDSFLTWFWYFFRTMISRFWGGLGMFEPPQLSPIAIVLATVAVVGLSVLAVVGRRRAGRTDRQSLAAGVVVLLLPVAFAYLEVGQRSWAEYQRYTRGIAVQGRYLYLGLVGLGVVVALGLRRALPGRERLAPLILLVGALLMQGAALLAICSYYWLPRRVSFTPARTVDVVSAIGRWAPFPIAVTITVFVLAALLFAGTIAAAVVQARRQPAPAPQVPATPAPVRSGSRRGDGDAGVVAQHEPVRLGQGGRGHDLDVPADQ
ncbi:glycosyltransferase family 39 protein [Frankia sp. AiPs1]|uniref:glycosyltransferase family 39 protein n=1 Tax=Frankia sp. AiPs1 TaxID=573493 RepID=UPI0020435581|nr:glycosyltransferase family 39 protein [Frankia sp. AiPs1]MCM3920892.1 glycosyltransferase family 39 protein [Frankia sp. AiPs1]